MIHITEGFLRSLQVSELQNLPHWPTCFLLREVQSAQQVLTW